MASRKHTASVAAQPSINQRAEFLAELGITAPLQRRLDRLARALRPARQELDDVYQACEPETDTEARCREGLARLEDVLYHLEWRAPDLDGLPS